MESRTQPQGLTLMLCLGFASEICHQPHATDAERCQLPKQTEVTVPCKSHLYNKKKQHWHQAFKWPSKSVSFSLLFLLVQTTRWEFPLLVGQLVDWSSLCLYVFMTDTLFIFSLASIAPSKREEIAASGFRALIAGTVACFMTACVAGTVPPFGVPPRQWPLHGSMLAGQT